MYVARLRRQSSQNVYTIVCTYMNILYIQLYIHFARTSTGKASEGVIMYVYTHVFMYVYTPKMYIQLYVHTCVHTYMNTCVCTYMSTPSLAFPVNVRACVWLCVSVVVCVLARWHFVCVFKLACTLQHNQFLHIFFPSRHFPVQPTATRCTPLRHAAIHISTIPLGADGRIVFLM